MTDLDAPVIVVVPGDLRFPNRPRTGTTSGRPQQVGQAGSAA